MTDPCRTDCPAGDCAGCAFPPRRSLDSRDTQLRAFEDQKRQEREFAFESRTVSARAHALPEAA